MHQALYRKWRPKAFSDVCGQEHITSVLTWQVANQKLSHAYLFCGSRGTGKTTCAKILAKAANCPNTVNGNPCNACPVCEEIDSGRSVEVLEMDAASNTGVDYIRDIREEVIFTPSQNGTRVYIIDEVHMLSEGAFNALLKTLEEPPAGVIFILATTEMQEIPATILSRCQRFDFRRISLQNIMDRLTAIAEAEGIDLTPDGARLIARLAQGGMRDAISLLELCAGEGKTVNAESVSAAAGVCGRTQVSEAVAAIAAKNFAKLLTQVAAMYRSSIDLSVFFSDLISYYRDMMVQKALKITASSGQVPGEVLDYSDTELQELIENAKAFQYQTLLYHVKLLEEAFLSMHRGEDKRVVAEMTLLRLCSDVFGDSPEAISARIAALEEKLTLLIAGGAIPKAAPATSQMPTSVSTVAAPQAAPQPVPAKVEQTAPSVDPDVRESYYGWTELVAQYEKIDQGGAPFLRGAQVFVDGAKRLHVELTDSFAKRLLDSVSAAGKLRAIAASEGDEFADVIIEVVKPDAPTRSAFDDLFN
ncbi:MAG: DNA polymerase III subunit gamma/tau [Clostridia bacterium]|nr:DNA polymerase III subunit gamma/tau [Clostridia bacterium]